MDYTPDNAVVLCSALCSLVPERWAHYERIFDPRVPPGSIYLLDRAFYEAHKDDNEIGAKPRVHEG